MRRAAYCVLLFTLVGCALSEHAVGADGGGFVDSRDSGDRTDAGAPLDDSEFDLFDPGAGLARCFNGLDDNDDGLTDCEDLSCRSNIGACCVGVSSPACCEAQPSVEFDITPCEGSLRACAEGFEVFGGVDPVGETFREDSVRTFLPRGEVDHSGVTFLDVFDPRQGEIVVEAAVASTVGHDEGGDAVFIALTDAERPSESPAPWVGWVVSANRGDASLLVGGENVGRRTIPSADFVRYRLRLSPEGRVELMMLSTDAGAWEQIASAEVNVERSLRLSVYGRTPNPSSESPAPARVSSLSVTTTRCDIPTALRLDGVVDITPPTASPDWDSDISSIQHATVVSHGDPAALWMAVSIDSRIYLAREQEGAFVLTTDLSTPALAESAEWTPQDPFLFDGPEGLELYFSSEGSIARAELGEDASSFEATSVEVVLNPAGMGEVIAFRNPAAFEFQGNLRLLVTEVRSGTQPRIGLYELAGESVARISTVRESPSEDLFAFDRDEVGSAAPLVSEGVLRIYYSGRRGARWAVGLLVSADGQNFAPTAQLVTGGEIGFAAIGTLEPYPLALESEVRLFYTGFDGVRYRVGSAAGPTPIPR